MPAQVIVFLTGYVLALVVHEAGHAVAGWVVGCPPRVINIGSGPVIFLARFWGATLTVRIWPMTGHVSIVAWPQRGRIRRMPFSAGGMAANCVAICLLALAASLDRGAAGILGAFAIPHGFVLVLTAIPSWRTIHGIRHASDGLRLFQLLFRPSKQQFAETYVQTIEALGPARRVPAAVSEDAGEIFYQVMRRDKVTEAWARRDAATSLRRVLQRDRLSVEEKLFVLESIISMELTYRDAGVSAGELDAWSGEALSLLDTISMRVTRGGVLAMLDRPAEARSTLLPVLDQPTELINAIGCRAFLAHAAAASGEGSEARRWMDEARSRVPPDGASDLLPLLAQLESHMAKPA